MKPPAATHRAARTAAAVLGLAAVAALAPSGAGAEPRLTMLEWTHPAPDEVLKYVVLYAFSLEEREKPTPWDVGKPVWGDHFGWTIKVPEKASVWVAVVAVGINGKESEPSPWRRYDWKPGQGPLRDAGQPYLVAEDGR